LLGSCGDSKSASSAKCPKRVAEHGTVAYKSIATSEKKIYLKCVIPPVFGKVLKIFVTNCDSSNVKKKKLVALPKSFTYSYTTPVRG